MTAISHGAAALPPLSTAQRRRDAQVSRYQHLGVPPRTDAMHHSMAADASLGALPAGQPGGAAASERPPAGQHPVTYPPVYGPMHPPARAAASGVVHSPFVPLLLATLALLGWLALQAQQMLAERDALAAARQSQQQTVDTAAKLRASLDALAADTQRMAHTGNPSAKLLVDELARRGVTINSSLAPDAAAAGGNAAPAAAKPTPR